MTEERSSSNGVTTQDSGLYDSSDNAVPDAEVEVFDQQVHDPVLVALENDAQEDDREGVEEDHKRESVRVPTDPPISTFQSSLSDSSTERRSFLFSFMADYPWPFLVFIPFVFALLVGFGWSEDNKVEANIAELWIAEDNSYARDRAYAASYNMDDLEATVMLAMAVSRDGKNLLTERRLEEFRARMEATENTTVSIGGIL